MGIVDISSHKSVWRGLEYYKQNKVVSYKENKDGTYEGIVEGSGNENYRVHLDMAHPRKSTCNCPMADGRMVICKHIVAVSFCVDESEAERFKNEKTRYSSEEDERRSKKYDKYIRYARSLPKSALCEAYAEIMVELDELKLKSK
ncbi:SWIM zinc finger [Lachnospiraceae bacterium XPB1003]|nr:SWIM zinc finger [Lachnospiraceae bacterium XPB1003]